MQRLPKWFFLLTMFKLLLHALNAQLHVTTSVKQVKRALLFMIDKLMSGSSLEGKAFFKKP